VFFRLSSVRFAWRAGTAVQEFFVVTVGFLSGLGGRCRVLSALVVSLFVAACSESVPSGSVTSSGTGALTAGQCEYFAKDGKIRICHATGSKKNPYTIVNVGAGACADSHAAHPGDYVAVNDPNCSGGGVLPPGAPCDSTLPCAEGYECGASKTCEPAGLCRNVTCTASDQCHVAYCNPANGQCVNEAKVDGFACNDGNACTKSDTCQAGTCTGTNPVVCAAAGQCFDAGTCNPSNGTCSTPAKAAGATCNDTSDATYSDTCNGSGTCTGTPVVCPANTACATYTANGTATCAATFADASVSCDDGSTATSGDHCDGSGGCAGAPVVCPANTACTSWVANGTDTCTPVHASAFTACNDGSDATYADNCDGAGACFGTAVVCPVDSTCLTYVPNGTATCTPVATAAKTACDDGSNATYSDSCNGYGTCLGKPVACASNTACTSYVANGTEKCAVIHASSATSCNDGSDATYADSCDGAGTCSGTPVSCPASNMCTSYVPNGTATCTASFASTGTGCDDGNASTYGDSCNGAGACSGTRVTCPADTACTTWSANGTATCTPSYAGPAITCNDGNASTYGDSCNGAGACTGLPVFCPAETQCTTYAANGTASCAADHRGVNTSCDDGRLSTYDDRCDGSGGCGGTTVTCPANSACVTYLADGTSTCAASFASSGTACDDGDSGTANDRCNGSGTCAGAPLTAPGAPTTVSASLSGSSAVVTFEAPASDGGSPVTSYRATSSPGGLTAASATSPITVPGLSAGVSYTFSVVAINAIGTSPASAPSGAVIIATAPGAPAITSVTGGNAQAIVAFSAPTNDGGSPITSYTVTSSPGGRTATGTASPLTVTGLTNGVSYTFTAKATNAIGTSVASAASSAVVPKGPPAAPTIGVVSQSGNTGTLASVAFTPGNNGGSPVTGFTVTSTPGGFTATGTSSPIVVPGLTPGTTYRFSVTATNIVGTSTASVLSAAFIPTGRPDAPTITGVVTSDRAITVSFTPPLNNGGVAISVYTATASPGGRTGIASGASPITITGLTPGETYTVTMTATNSRGVSPASAASDPVTVPTDADVVVLTFNASFGQYVDVATGYLFNPTDGSEVDPTTGEVRVLGGFPPPTLILDDRATFLSYDHATQRYYTYRSSTVDIPNQVELDRSGDPLATVGGPLYLLTQDLKVVDVYDGAFVAAGTHFAGVLLDPATLQPIDGTTVTFEPLQAPSVWTYP
jgi:hypothetical protein